MKCLVVSAVREGKESSSLVESEPHHGSGAVAGQSSVEQAWKWVQRSELETGGSADSVSQTHLEVRQRAQPDDKVLLGPAASAWKCPHLCSAPPTRIHTPLCNRMVFSKAD